MSEIQTDLFDPTPVQEFEAWKTLPGAGHVLARCYKITARYAPEALRTGIPVSMKLIWELTRHHIKHVRERGEGLGLKPAKWHGYRLNNNHTASVARHIMDRRPEWKGIFELRDEWGAEKRNQKTRVIVVKPERDTA